MTGKAKCRVRSSIWGLLTLVTMAFAGCTNDTQPDIIPPVPQFTDTTTPPNPNDARMYADVDPTKNAIWLEWYADESRNTTGYELYRSNDDTVADEGLLKNATQIARFETTNDVQDELPTSYRDTTGIQSGGTYYYQLRAYHRAPTGIVRYSAPTGVGDSTSFKFDEPVELVSPNQTVAVPDIGLNFVWHDDSWHNGGMFQIIVQRLDTKEFVWSSVITSFGSVIQTTYPSTAPHLEPNVPYRWRVKRINVSRPGGFSSAWFAFQVQ
jgi:hypothetical protein